MKYIIGIDIGGTKISIVLASYAGRILHKVKFKTKTGSATRKSIQDILHFIAGLLTYRKIKRGQLLGIGIGVPGPVDPKREKIERSPNLPGWDKVPLKRILSKQFKCPVFIENDANAAALGEKHFGAGRGISDFAYVTVSTGVGSGIISNDKLVTGARGAAGEIGHATIVTGGDLCGCGKRGCLEAYASGTSIGKYAARELKKHRSSMIPKFCEKKGIVTGEAVSLAADHGDQLAIQIRKRAADYLGVGLANLMNTLNPKRIILGGGVLESTAHFWKPMLLSVKREAWKIPHQSCKIVKTKLRRVGDLGAIAVALERLRDK